MLEKKSFTGGLNTDIEDRLLPSTDWKGAWNIHALTTDKNSVGAIEKARGDKFVTGLSGDTGDIVETIGAYEDKENKKIYYFIYAVDSFNNKLHAIHQYDVVTGVTTQLVANNANLNFNRNNRITGIACIDNKYLMWTDDLNEPGFLNLTKARTGALISATTQQLRLIPYAPVDPITYTYESDTSINKNNLRGKLWQFKYRFVYDDDRKSAFSVISKITYPNEFQDKNSYSLNVNSMDITKNNKIVMSIPIPNVGDIAKVEIAVREGNLNDFKIIKTLTTENTGYETFDISSNFSGFKKVEWYNDEPFKSISTDESNALFSFVPLKAKSLDLVNSNRLVLGNIVEGFDNVDISKTTHHFLNPTQVSPSESNLRPGSLNPLGVFDDFAIVSTDVYGYDDFQYHVVKVGENVYPNQKYTINLVMGDGTMKTYSYLTSGSSTNTDIINSFSSSISNDFRDSVRNNNYPVISPRVPTANGIMYSFPDTVNPIQTRTGTYISGGTGTFDGEGGGYLFLNHIGNSNEDRVETYTVNVDYTSDTIDSTSISSFKSNAYHKFGIVYYDESGRASTVQTSELMKAFQNPWNGDYNYGKREFIISISHYAPLWAKKYQIVYSGALGYLQDPSEGRGFTQFMVNQDATQYDTSPLTGVVKWRVSLDSTLWYSSKYNNNPITYTWKKGDRLRKILDINGDPINPIDQRYTDFTILYYDSAQLEVVIETDLNYKPKEGEWYEVYTPSNNTNADLFYETGEVFNIVNRMHTGNLGSAFNQTITGSGSVKLTWGDVFLKNRTMDKTDPTTGTNEVTNVVEDSHFSDFYRSNFYNKGRPNIYSPDSKQIRRISTIRYSQFYIPDTNINGLGTFFDLSFMDYDKFYGKIQKLRNKGKSLLVFQEIKTGKVLVNEQILSDLSTLEAVQKSDTVLSDITYYAEDFGIGNHPESYAEFGNSSYFVDAYRGAVLRLGLNGITKISDAFMHTFFNNTLPKFINSRLWGVYNERFNSYLLSFDSLDNQDPYSISFHEPTNRWVSFYNFGSNTSVTHGVNILTFKEGKGYLSNSPDVPYGKFHNVQYPCSVEIAFNENPSTVKLFKNIEIESNDIWTCYIYNQNGQESNLIKEDFDKIENIYWASLWKDINSDGGLISGDDLRGNELIIKLSNDSTNFVKMLTVGAKYDNSELTNR